jgi:hypothetical protein
LTLEQRHELQQAYGFTPGDLSELNGEWTDDSFRRWAEAKMCQNAAKAIAAHGQTLRSKGVYLPKHLDAAFDDLRSALTAVFNTHDTGVRFSDRQLTIEASVKCEKLLSNEVRALRSQVQDRLSQAVRIPDQPPS